MGFQCVFFLAGPQAVVLSAYLGLPRYSMFQSRTLIIMFGPMESRDNYSSASRAR